MNRGRFPIGCSIAENEINYSLKFEIMKRFNVIIAVAVIFSAMFFQSCNKDETVEPNKNDESILPANFKVDIPDAISGADYFKDSNVDTLQGNDIYQHMRTFIYIGDQAAGMVNEIIHVIAGNNLSQPMSFSYVSDDDGRTKHVVIIENSFFEGVTWEYQMTITDEDSEVSDNTAMQIFWNKNPIKGISIVNPYNLDRTISTDYEETMYRIDYSEAFELGYERHMIVAITGFPVADPLENQYSMKTMKMFVGKNANMISVFGNSDHPNATFFNSEVGFDWAFAAAGDRILDIGVAEVGLPRNTLNSSNRNTLLVENSIKNVFTNQIYEVWPWIDSTSVQSYLYNTDAPGFFDHGGFVQGGTSPGTQYNPLLGILPNLTPYNPAVINELEIEFKP